MAVGLRVSNTKEDKEPTRYFSKKQEKGVAKALNGRVQVNSGATDFKKGDVTTDQFLIECKTKASHSESISIKKEWLTKNRQEALFMGKPYNALVFSFGPNEENHYVIDEELFIELLEYLRNK